MVKDGVISLCIRLFEADVLLETVVKRLVGNVSVDHFLKLFLTFNSHHGLLLVFLLLMPDKFY